MIYRVGMLVKNNKTTANEGHENMNAEIAAIKKELELAVAQLGFPNGLKGELVSATEVGPGVYVVVVDSGLRRFVVMVQGGSVQEVFQPGTDAGLPCTSVDFARL